MGQLWSSVKKFKCCRGEGRAFQLLVVVFLSKLCRIIELFELEGASKGHLVQLPCSEQGHLQLHQGAQSSVQLLDIKTGGG